MNFREVGHLLDPSAEGSLPRLNLSVQPMLIVSLPGLDLGAQSTLVMRTMSFEEEWEKLWAVVEGKEISRHLYITVHPSEEKTSSRSSQLTFKSLKNPPFHSKPSLKTSASSNSTINRPNPSPCNSPLSTLASLLSSLFWHKSPSCIPLLRWRSARRLLRSSWALLPAGVQLLLPLSTLTNVGNTRITGSCGTSPGTEITGFPPGVCTKTNSAGGIAADNAEAACLNAYNNAAAKVPTAALRASDLGRGLTLPPGVYTFPTSAATLTGTLTLDGASNRRGQWIFQITTTFTASAASQIRTINGAQACNVYFIVGSSANIQAGAKLVGNILAYTSISASDASNNGSWCALNGAVTLINNALTAQSVCST